MLATGTRLPAIALALLALGVLGAPAASADHSTIELVSDRVQAGADVATDVPACSTRCVSSDGTRVWFTTAEPLVAADGDTARDVYQRQGVVTTLLSDRIQAGADAATDAVLAGAASDGLRVFIETAEPLVNTDGDTATDVYQRFGTSTTLLSDRIQAGADSADPVTFGGASSTGLRVFFSTVEPLLTADGDSVRDVYERNGTTTTLLSDRVQAGADAALGADYRGNSADGTRVFVQTLEPLVTTDGDAAADVYQRSGTTTTLLSDRIQAGVDGNFDATFAGASADGMRVFFHSNEPILGGDNDFVNQDVFQRVGTTTTLLSDRPQAGQDQLTPATFQGATASGTGVFFTTSERLVPEDTDNNGDVYRRGGTTTTIISDRFQAGPDANAFATFVGTSLDGSRVFFRTGEQITSADGDNTFDIYQRQGAISTLLSDRVQPGADAASPVDFAGASSDGTRVFMSTVEPLLEDDEDAVADVYERNATETTLLTSIGPRTASFYTASSDGRRVYFRTADRLVAADRDTAQDIYLTRVLP